MANSSAYQELTMSPRNKQQKVRKFYPIGQPNSQSMRFQMVDGEERLPCRPSQTLCRRGAHDQAADQARAGRSSYPVDLAETDTSHGERARYQRIEMVEVCARCNLGHDPAIRHVLRELAVDQIGKDLWAGDRRRHDGGSALVAAGFDA